uniref:Uncharacterized protein n=1 Tax=Arundo donax TaxID=35708 RepID=A0A0A8XUB8_ARUDO
MTSLYLISFFCGNGVFITLPLVLFFFLYLPTIYRKEKTRHDGLLYRKSG